MPKDLSRIAHGEHKGERGYDPNQHQQSWDTAWHSLTQAAGFAGLRFHDLRHTFITHMVELGVPLGVIQTFVGHMSAGWSGTTRMFPAARHEKLLNCWTPIQSLRRFRFRKKRSTVPDLWRNLGRNSKAPRRTLSKLLKYLVSAAGLEPATHALKGRPVATTLYMFQ